MANKPTGYVATWGKNAQKSDFEIISDLALFFRHIGLEHGEWNLITCLFAHKAKDIDPVYMEHLTSYFRCSEQHIQKWIKKLRDQDYIVMSKKKQGEHFVWTMDCSPIIEKVEKFLNELPENEEDNKYKFPANAKKAIQLELAI